MSIFRDFFVKEKPVFTGIARGLGGFGFAIHGVGGSSAAASVVASGGAAEYTFVHVKDIEYIFSQTVIRFCLH